jgi:general secretion pathway protein G
MYASRKKCLEIPMNGEKGKQMLETIKGRAETVQRRKGDEGFTLIELLVVIVILAILAAIVVFAVGGINDKGQASACDTDLKTIQTAEEGYFAKGGPSGQGGVYVDGAGLAAAGYLTSPPSLHDVTVLNNGANYQIADHTAGVQNPCTNATPPKTFGPN